LGKVKPATEKKKNPVVFKEFPLQNNLTLCWNENGFASRY